MAAAVLAQERPVKDVPVIAEGLFSFDFGGSERVGADLALEFCKRGYRVVCFAFHGSDGPMRELLEASGVRCVDLNYGKSRGRLRRVWYTLKLWRMLRRERVRALHVHHHGALILCGIAARLAGIRHVVMTEHGLQALQERPDARALTMRYARFATDITVVESGQADYFRDVLRIEARKIHCIANGVRIPERSASAIARLRARLGIDAATFAFFYVGRLNAVKDLCTLLEAFALLPADVAAAARLFLVGDGPERALLEQRCDALGLRARVSFLGARADAATLLMAADGFVMSSKSEGLPMVLLEAMAAGVPCVATAVGGIPALFGADRGILAPPQDANSLCQAMARLARDSALRRSLAEAALLNLRAHFSMGPITTSYLKLLGLPSGAEEGQADTP